MLTREGQERVATGPNDLRGCVAIATEHEALEYLRFFSSHWMTHFFERAQMEIFVAADGKCGPGSCLPTHRWESLSLKPPLVEKRSGGFGVRRNIVRPKPGEYDVSGFQVTELVAADGAVSLVSEVALPLEKEDRARLVFLRYL